MTVRKIVATLIWLFWLLAIAHSLLNPQIHNSHLPPLPPLAPLTSTKVVIVLLPAVFFTVAAVWGGYPFDSVRWRRWADRKWGDGAYVRFIQDLKPMLLFAAAPAAGAVACLLHAYRETAPIDTDLSCGFALSFAVGFLLARVILARRGLLMESRSPSAWVERPAPSPAFLPAAIRRLRATNATAFLAGVGMVAGMHAIDALGSYPLP
jgi:hypothetical protein